MVKIEDKISLVLDKSKKDFPGGGIYWDMGIIHQESTMLINTELERLCNYIKNRFSIDFDEKQIIKDAYEYYE